MKTLQVEDYHVGIICALDIELAAVEAMLDEEHEPSFRHDIHDHNTYSMGRIHAHNVVIACLPAGEDGTTAAAIAAKDISRTFKQLRVCLLVGIGGGIPDLEQDIDVRLGDVVVSMPSGTTGGVVQYDKGKSKMGGAWDRKGMLNAPPRSLLSAVQKLRARHLRHASVMSSLVADMLQRFPAMANSGYAYPGQDQDVLRCATGDRGTFEDVTGPGQDGGVISRPQREVDVPKIHYGIIASGNQVVKDAVVRDGIRRACQAICVEMEAAGLMNELPCLVIRDICDYADAHKNDRWQKYAAATAAAYAKELLSCVSPEQTKHEMSLTAVLGTLEEHFQRLDVHHARHEDYLFRQEQRHQEDKQHRCHQTFNTSDYEEHKNRNPERVPGTCLWLLNNETYLRWRKNDHSDLLWISADPGCGKSVLARSLIDNDLRGGGYDSKITICYYFFKDNGEQGYLATALCAILHQLFSQQPLLIRHALSAWEAKGHKVASEIQSLWRILYSATADPEAQHTVCVLDALDECRDIDRKSLIGELCGFYNDATRGFATFGKLKFLVTSRPYNDIEYHFGSITNNFPYVRLRGEDQNDQIRSEIDLVVQQRVHEISKEFRLSFTTTERLQKRLLAMKHRTYLWIHLAADSIRTTFSQSLRPDLEDVELLPASVDEAYEQILSRVDEKQVRMVQTILRIIVGAPRPLTVGEMALAIDIATSDPCPERLSQLSVREDQLIPRICQWCGLFVFINNSRLYLIHQTAKEFLIGNHQQEWGVNGGWKHCLRTTDIEQEMARIYIRYLCLENFDAPPVRIDGWSCDKWRTDYWRDLDTEDDAVYGKYGITLSPWPDHVRGLFLLASETWVIHWRNVEVATDTVTNSTVLKLYDEKTQRFKRWSSVFGEAQRKLLHYPKNGLVLAAYNGHAGVVQRLIRDKLQDVEARDHDDRSALMRAIDMNYQVVIDILLKAGADINALAPDESRMSYWSGRRLDALGLASTYGNRELVGRFLDAGADVNANDGAALTASSRSGDTAVAQLLLNAGADVNANKGAALSNASMYDNRDVVHLLLDAGANVNADNGAALSNASRHGCEDIVRLLLDAGADVNANKGSALRTALMYGHDRVTDILLAAGATKGANDGVITTESPTNTHGGLKHHYGTDRDVDANMVSMGYSALTNDDSDTDVSAKWEQHFLSASVYIHLTK